MDNLQVPNDDRLKSALLTYQPSAQTTSLRSEKSRKIVAENFNIKKVPPLSTLCLKVLATNYITHPIVFKINLKPIQLRTYCDFIDADLPLETCLGIDDEYYWKRIFSLKCLDKMQLKETINRDNISWKDLAITLLYTELIENTRAEMLIPEKIEEITKSVSQHITNLNIKKLQPNRKSNFENDLTVSENSINSLMSIKSKESKRESPKEQLTEKRFEFLPNHLDLSIIRNLYNLNAMTLEIVPPKLGTNYDFRYFNFSYLDIQNLASGLSELKNLKVLKIRRSRMDCKKLSIILEALEEIHVEVLEFYFCQLDDNCGESLFNFLKSTSSLKYLDLSGNYFKDSAIDYISKGMTNSKITYVAFSNNPISDEGLYKLTTCLQTCNQLHILKLSGIKNSKRGTFHISDLLRINLSIAELEIIAIPIDGCILIEALELNTQIQQLFCQGSGLSLEEEFKVDLLLRRNRYIKANPYIGDTKKTEEEIKEFVNRIKNPIFLRSKTIQSRNTECQKAYHELNFDGKPRDAKSILE